jgi:hypothetical protein
VQRGASISGALHLVLVVLAVWGADWFRDREPVPLNVTEIEMVDGTELDARLSTAPVVPSEGPAELAPPSEGQSVPTPEAPPEEAADHASAAALSVSAPPEPRPDAPRITIPPPPTDVPSEAPVPTIAEIPSPDPLRDQSKEPESPPSTEPVQPLASVRPPTPSPRPLPPPEAEPEPEPEPEPEVAETVPQPTAPQPPKPAEQTPPPPEPEPELAAAEPDAEQSLAPQEGRLPIARPADKARAAPASSKPEPAQQQVASAEPKPEKEPTPQAQAEPKPSKPAGGSTRPTAPLNNGEKDALRIGIKKYYVYNGDRSDRSLQVTIRVQLDQQARITGKPEMLGAQGGNPAAQKALFDAGRRALLQAQAQGEFNRLPKDKYAAWSVLNVVFTTEQGVDFSS